MSRYSFNLEEVNRERRKLGKHPLTDKEARKIAANTSLNTDLGMALLAEASVALSAVSDDSRADTSTPTFESGGGDFGGGGGADTI